MNLKTLSAFLGAIALITIPASQPIQAEEALICPDEFHGIELSQDQERQLQALADSFDNKMAALPPVSPESEAQITELEKAFEENMSSFLSPEQEQQIEQLDAWTERRINAIAPELFDSEFESDTEPTLTAEQEAELATLETEYEKKFQAIVPIDQQQQLEDLELQLAEDMTSTMADEANAEQVASLDAAEADYEQGIMQILTAEQRQQLASNMACAEPELEATTFE